MSLKYNDSQKLRSFLVRLFGAQANGWPMNERIFNLTYKLVASSASCSRGMDFVPSSINPFSNALKQLGKQAVKKFIQELSNNEKYYETCLRGAAYVYAGEFRRAAQGV